MTWLAVKLFFSGALKRAWALLQVQLTVPLWVWLILGSMAYAYALYATADGVRAGKAHVQATIDRPLTGWRARLEQCHGSLKEQNAAIKARSDEATKTINTQTRTLHAVAPVVRRAAEQAQVLSKPLVADEACARVMEQDRRFLDTLK